MSPHGKKDDLPEADVNDLMDAIFGDDPAENDMKDDGDEEETETEVEGETEVEEDEDEEEDEEDGEDENEYEDDEQVQHPTKNFIVPHIDPDSVDFEPLFQDHSAVPVNYHDVSHGDTEYHRLLHNKSNSNTKAALQPQSTSKDRERTNGFASKIQRCFQKSSRKHKHQEETDYMRFVVIGMLLFIFYVLYSHVTDESETLHLNGHVVTKRADGSFHQSTITRFIEHAPDDTIVPSEYDGYRDVDDLPLQIMDTPTYWHIPRSGGTTMKLVMSMCMGRVLACEQGAGHQLDEQLVIINKAFGNFANVDTSTPLGLEHAAEMGLIPARLVDVVMTPHIREAAQLFDVHHKGRLFAMFRHPIERIESLYYFLRMPDQQAAVGLAMDDMTLEEFATDYSENWMVRSLVGVMVGPINQSHLNSAKQILRKKFLIGLLEEKTESLRRIEAYFGWKLPSRVAQTCKNNMYYFEPQSKNVHPSLDPTTEAYDAMLAVNIYDVQLYEYAKSLFEEQAALIST